MLVKNTYINILSNVVGASIGFFSSILIVRVYGVSVVGKIAFMTGIVGLMTFMVDLATTLSFLTAPILAVFNYKVVTGKHMPLEAVPPKWLKILSWAGFVFLTGFSLIFLYFKFLK